MACCQNSEYPMVCCENSNKKFVFHIAKFRSETKVLFFETQSIKKALCSYELTPLAARMLPGPDIIAARQTTN